MEQYIKLTNETLCTKCWSNSAKSLFTDLGIAGSGDLCTECAIEQYRSEYTDEEVDSFE